MPLPKDATIEQVAKAFGVTDRMNQLTPAARKLTKGQMLALLGMQSGGEAVRSIAVGWKRPDATTIQNNARAVGLKLTLADIQSVQKVFIARLPTGERQAIAASFVSRQLGTGPVAPGLEIGDINIYCCCCPCCCGNAAAPPTSCAPASSSTERWSRIRPSSSAASGPTAR